MFQGQFNREHLKTVIKATQNHSMFICSGRHFNSALSTRQTFIENPLSAGHCAGCQNANKQGMAPRGLRLMDDSHLSVNIYRTLLDPGAVMSTRNTRVDKASKTPMHRAYVLVKEMDNTVNAHPLYLQGIHSRSPSGCLNPWRVPNTIHSFFPPIHTYL